MSEVQALTGTAAVSWGRDRIDLFTVDETHGLVHRFFMSGTWSGPTSLGGTLASAPAATAWAPDQLQVFAIFDDGQLWNRYWDGTSWHALGVARRRADRDPGCLVMGRRPDRRLGARSRRLDLAPLVGRHPLGRVGAAPPLSQAAPSALRRGVEDAAGRTSDRAGVQRRAARRDGSFEVSGEVEEGVVDAGTSLPWRARCSRRCPPDRRGGGRLGPVLVDRRCSPGG